MPRKRKVKPAFSKRSIATLCKWLAGVPDGLTSLTSIEFKDFYVSMRVENSPMSVALRLALNCSPMADIRGALGANVDRNLDAIVSSSQVTFVIDDKEKMTLSHYDGASRLVSILGHIFRACGLDEMVQTCKSMPPIFSGVIRLLQDRRNEPGIVMTLLGLLKGDIYATQV